MDNSDLYVELGVPRGATQDEIRQAFKALARRYHPDRNPDDIPTQEKFQRVTKAYEVLSDPQKRSAYDRLSPLYNIDKSPQRRMNSVDLHGYHRRMFKSHPRYRLVLT